MAQGPPGPRPHAHVADWVYLAVFAVAASAIMAPILLVISTTPPAQKPVIGFTGVTLSGGTAFFVITDVSQAVSYTNYKFNLKVNGTFGTAKALGASGTAVTISVISMTYTVTYTDVGNDGKVNGGDQFAVSGLRFSTQYVFVLLWSDGSVIESRSWATP